MSEIWPRIRDGSILLQNAVLLYTLDRLIDRSISDRKLLLSVTALSRSKLNVNLVGSKLAFVGFTSPLIPSMFIELFTNTMLIVTFLKITIVSSN